MPFKSLTVAEFDVLRTLGVQSGVIGIDAAVGGDRGETALAVMNALARQLFTAETSLARLLDDVDWGEGEAQERALVQALGSLRDAGFVTYDDEPDRLAVMTIVVTVPRPESAFLWPD